MMVTFLSPSTRIATLSYVQLISDPSNTKALRSTINLGFKSTSFSVLTRFSTIIEYAASPTTRNEMAPLTPYWARPSHPSIQEVCIPSDPSQFTTKSLSKVNLAPYAVFAKMAFPPCTRAEKPTYATVQMGKNEHLNLNSDLVYINHSCDPSLVSLHRLLLLSSRKHWKNAGEVATPPSESGPWPLSLLSTIRTLLLVQL